jgi:hypothetical protein
MLKAQNRKQFIDLCRDNQVVTPFDFVRRSPFSLDGQEYMAKATSALGVSFSMYRRDEVIVVEKTTSLLANAQQIEHDGRTWLMKPAHFFRKNVQCSIRCRHKSRCHRACQIFLPAVRHHDRSAAQCANSATGVHAVACGEIVNDRHGGRHIIPRLETYLPPSG